MSSCDKHVVGVASSRLALACVEYNGLLTCY